MRRFISGSTGHLIYVRRTLATSAAEAQSALSAGAVSGPMKALAADYTKKFGNTVTFTFGNVGQIQDHLKAGDAADIIILSKPALDDLAKARGLVAGSMKPLGRVGMGVAIKAGAQRPNIATADAFKAALLATPSIAYSDPAGGGSSGVFFDQLIRKLGIADQIRAKGVLIRGGSAADPIIQGKAAMAITECVRADRRARHPLCRRVPRRRSELHHLFGRRCHEGRAAECRSVLHSLRHGARRRQDLARDGVRDGEISGDRVNGVQHSGCSLSGLVRSRPSPPIIVWYGRTLHGGLAAKSTKRRAQHVSRP